MRLARLSHKTLLIMVVLFGVIAAATSLLSAWELHRRLTAEYRSKGMAIAKSIADSAVELILNSPSSSGGPECLLNGRHWMENIIMNIRMMLHGDPGWWARNIFPGMHGMADIPVLIKPQDFYLSLIMQKNSGIPELLLLLM